MKLRKFFGLTSRSVLEQIRAELGPDAVIVANHPTPQGVEISALAGDAMDSLLAAPSAQRASVQPKPAAQAAARSSAQTSYAARAAQSAATSETPIAQP